MIYLKYIVFFLALFSTTVNAQTVLWGTNGLVGSNDGEFQSNFTPATVYSAGSNPITWTALTVNEDSGAVFPGNAYWERSTTGQSQGAYWGGQPAFASPSAANGVALFDSDFLDNNGSIGTLNQGSSPANHIGELISPRIDLTGNTDSTIGLKFYCNWRPGQATNFSVSLSVDDGLTWISTADVNNYLTAAPNQVSIGWVDIQFHNATAGVANLSQCRMKFTFDGGYYYAMLDDVCIYGNATGIAILRGEVYSDLNLNCTKDPGEISLGAVPIQINGLINFYGITDFSGNYYTPIDTGTYQIAPISNTPYWQPCPIISLNIPAYNIVTTLDIPLQPVVLCPMLQVDLSTSILRETASTPYYVSYCNIGTVDATNAYVEVELDPLIIVNSTSIPIVSQNNNIYTFNLGTVAVGECNTFSLFVIVDTVAILGQTLCSEARIFPDSICLPNLWSGPNLKIAAVCTNDTIAFTINNIGAAMAAPTEYYVYEDNVMFRSGFTNVLGNGASQQLIQAASPGKTYRLEVDQLSGFPLLLGDSIASATIEGCNPYPSGLFNIGFVNQFSNGNSSPFVAVDCEAVSGSYDPNDKSAQPTGYDNAQHFIYDYTPLDYKVRFQNTGTDTAFLVVIRDTISPYLDLSTLEMGASSHPYTWRIYGQGILEISFSYIMLPDSNVNEPASNGFVRYRIRQQAGNPIGTVIYNSAAIYFDYNLPIITNRTWHTIGDDFITILISNLEVLDASISVNVFPNPFTHSTTIEVQGKEYEDLQLSVFDIMGREVAQGSTQFDNQIQLSRGNLLPGVYVYQLSGNQQLISTGKIIVR